MRRESLIGYAMSFASFLLDSEAGGSIRKIILFGSVARGDFDSDSDIDVFIDADENMEKGVNKVLTMFRMSRVHEAWKLKGVENDISLKIGDLREWSLRREVLSSGVLLYGKYSETPENTTYYLLVTLDASGMKASRQVSMWRKLYGYRQKVGKKTYENKGLVESLGGRKIGKAVFLVPMENRMKVIAFLNKNKVRYTVHELWSDTL